MNKSDNKIFGLLVILKVSFVVIPPIGWLQNCNREKRGFFFTFFDDWVKSLYYRSNFYFENGVFYLLEKMSLLF